MFGLSFLTSGMVKNLAIGLALLFAFGAVYSYGHSNGHTAGFQEGFDSRQSTIDKLVTTINDDRTAQATKIKAIEAKASEDVVAAIAEKAAQEHLRVTIATDFITQHPDVAAKCGLEATAIEAVNTMLGTQKVYDNVQILIDDMPLPADPNKPPTSAPPTEPIVKEMK